MLVYLTDFKQHNGYDIMVQSGLLCLVIDMVSGVVSASLGFSRRLYISYSTVMR
jgi:hypothetical protein